jgi:hypothetical protein
MLNNALSVIVGRVAHKAIRALLPRAIGASVRASNVVENFIESLWRVRHHVILDRVREYKYQVIRLGVLLMVLVDYVFTLRPYSYSG